MAYYFDVMSGCSPTIDAHGLDLNDATDAIDVARAILDDLEPDTQLRIRADYQVLGWLKGSQFIVAPGMSLHSAPTTLH